MWEILTVGKMEENPVARANPVGEAGSSG